MENTISPYILRKYAYNLHDCMVNIMNIEILSDVYEIQIDRFVQESENVIQILEASASIYERNTEALCSQISSLIDFASTVDIKTWWEQAYPIIDQIVTMTSAITGVTAFINWIRKKLREKNVTNEDDWIKLILKEDKWNTYLLSQKLGLSENDTRKILKGFGYVWDPKKMLYIASDNTQKLRNIKSS